MPLSIMGGMKIFACVLTALGVFFTVVYFVVPGPGGGHHTFLLLPMITDYAVAFGIFVNGTFKSGEHWEIGDNGALHKVVYGGIGLAIVISVGLSIAGFVVFGQNLAYNGDAETVTVVGMHMMSKQFVEDDPKYPNGLYYVYTEIELSFSRHEVTYMQYFTDIYSEGNYVGYATGEIEGDYQPGQAEVIQITFSASNPREGEDDCFLAMYNQRDFDQITFEAHVYTASGPDFFWHDDAFVNRIKERGIFIL